MARGTEGPENAENDIFQILTDFLVHFNHDAAKLEANFQTRRSVSSAAHTVPGQFADKSS